MSAKRHIIYQRASSSDSVFTGVHEGDLILLRNGLKLHYVRNDRSNYCPHLAKLRGASEAYWFSDTGACAGGSRALEIVQISRPAKPVDKDARWLRQIAHDREIPMGSDYTMQRLRRIARRLEASS